MATDQATTTDGTEAEHVDINIGGDGDTDWGKMDSKERESSVAETVAGVQAKRDPADEAASKKSETDKTSKADDTETTETSAADDDTSVDDDAAKITDEDGTETEDKGKGKEGESAEWLDEDTRDLATAMGLSDEDLADFGSREELDRALRIVNRQAFEAGKVDGKQSKQTVDDDQQRQEAYRQQKGQQETQQKEDEDPLADLTKFKLGDEFDEEAAKPLNEFVRAASEEIRNLRSEVAQMREAGEQEAEAGIRRQALESLHSLGHVELFGKADATLTAKQAANVEKAIEAHFIHANGLFAMGRRAAPTPAFLKVAVNMEFGDDITKQQQRRLTDKLRKQSERRTGGPATKSLPKPPPADETSRQRARRFAADDLQQCFDNLADRS